MVASRLSLVERLISRIETGEKSLQADNPVKFLRIRSGIRYGNVIAVTLNRLTEIVPLWIGERIRPLNLITLILHGWPTQMKIVAFDLNGRLPDFFTVGNWLDRNIIDHRAVARVDGIVKSQSRDLRIGA